MKKGFMTSEPDDVSFDYYEVATGINESSSVRNGITGKTQRYVLSLFFFNSP